MSQSGTALVMLLITAAWCLLILWLLANFGYLLALPVVLGILLSGAGALFRAGTR